MTRFFNGSHIAINQPGTPFNGATGTVEVHTMADLRYSLVTLDSPVEGLTQVAVRKSNLIISPKEAHKMASKKQTTANTATPTNGKYVEPTTAFAQYCTDVLTGEADKATLDKIWNRVEELFIADGSPIPTRPTKDELMNKNNTAQERANVAAGKKASRTTEPDPAKEIAPAPKPKAKASRTGGLAISDKNGRINGVFGFENYRSDNSDAEGNMPCAFPGCTKVIGPKTPFTLGNGGAIHIHHKQASGATVTPTTTTKSTYSKPQPKHDTSVVKPNFAAWRAAHADKDGNLECRLCDKPIGPKAPFQVATDGTAEFAQHIHHMAEANRTTKATPATKAQGKATVAKGSKPCRMCLAEVEAGDRTEASTDTYFAQGTKHVNDARKQVMVNTYLCLDHLNSIEWNSSPRFVGRTPEGFTPNMFNATPTPAPKGKGGAKAKTETPAPTQTTLHNTAVAVNKAKASKVEPTPEPEPTPTTPVAKKAPAKAAPAPERTITPVPKPGRKPAPKPTPEPEAKAAPVKATAKGKVVIKQSNVKCAVCGGAFATREPRTKNAAGQPIHIGHARRATR